MGAMWAPYGLIRTPYGSIWGRVAPIWQCFINSDRAASSRNAPRGRPGTSRYVRGCPGTSRNVSGMSRGVPGTSWTSPEHPWDIPGRPRMTRDVLERPRMPPGCCLPHCLGITITIIFIFKFVFFRDHIQSCEADIVSCFGILQTRVSESYK